MTACVFAGLLFSGCALVPKERALAPQPLKIVDQQRLYTGLWHEYARTPSKDTRDCAAPTTEFFRDGDGLLFRRDVCAPSGRKGRGRVLAGAVEILNPGPDSKILVRERVMGAFYIPKIYWVLDHGQDYGWFIASDPEFRSVSVFTREARPSAALQQRLLQRLRALGAEASALEFPAPQGGAAPAG
jgi:apolipoprotein D and lipocalin family protein